MKIFFDTTKLEKLRNAFVIFEVGIILLMLLSFKTMGSEEITLLSEMVRGNVYLFADNKNLTVLLPVFYMIILLACTLQIITLRAWIQSVESAQRYSGNEKEEKSK